jgi:hypothetical protein
MAERKRSASRTRPTRTKDGPMSLFGDALQNAEKLHADNPALTARMLAKLEAQGLPYYRPEKTLRKWYRPPEVLQHFLAHGHKRNQPRKKRG